MTTMSTVEPGVAEIEGQNESAEQIDFAEESEHKESGDDYKEDESQEQEENEGADEPDQPLRTAHHQLKKARVKLLEALRQREEAQRDKENAEIHLRMAHEEEERAIRNLQRMEQEVRHIQFHCEQTKSRYQDMQMVVQFRRVLVQIAEVVRGTNLIILEHLERQIQQAETDHDGALQQIKLLLS